jgi:hypothetical protein
MSTTPRGVRHSTDAIDTLNLDNSADDVKRYRATIDKLLRQQVDASVQVAYTEERRDGYTLFVLTPNSRDYVESIVKMAKKYLESPPYEVDVKAQGRFPDPGSKISNVLVKRDTIIILRQPLPRLKHSVPELIKWTTIWGSALLILIVLFYWALQKPAPSSVPVSSF